MPSIQYDEVAKTNYAHIGGQGLANGRLQNYFNGCFQQVIDAVACYPAWACISCIGGSKTTAEFGNLPNECPACGSRRVFEVATFQGRASIAGKVFESAVRYLLSTIFELPAVPTPGNTNTHDVEITPRIAIETKGSRRYVQNPDSTVTTIGRPGLERSDTWKKAQANARNFRRLNPSTPFYIVTNALPPSLVGYRSDDITGIFNITQVNRITSLVAEMRAVSSKRYLPH